MKIYSTLERSIIGFTIGDILGVPYEFKKRGSFTCNNLRASHWNDAHFILPKGSWSDDTSLLLCVLDSLSETKEEQIYKKFRKNAIQWAYCGKFTNHGFKIPYDVGSSCRKGINSMLLHKSNKKASNINSNGNGGLMRMLPVAFIPNIHTEEIINYIKLSEYERILSMNIINVSELSIKSTGYIVDTLEAVVWCLANTSSYKDAVLKAVNLGGDTDTIAALIGGLAAIMYDDIPYEWINCIRRYTLLQQCCDKASNGLLSASQ